MVSRFRSPFLVLVFSYFSFFVAGNLARLLFPEVELLVDYSSRENSNIRVSSFEQNGTISLLQIANDGSFAGMISGIPNSPPKKLEIKFLDPERGAALIRYDDREVSSTNVYFVKNILHERSVDCDYLVVRVGSISKLHQVMKVILTIAIPLGVLLLIFSPYLLTYIVSVERSAARQPRDTCTLRGLSWFCYSSTVFEHLRRIDYLFLGLLFVLTLPILTGCDAVPMYRIVELFLQGIDPYQFQVNHKAFAHFEFLNFPYNPPILLSFALMGRVLEPLGALFPWARTVDWSYVLPFKVLNFLLTILTVLSCLSFMIDQGLLRSGVRKVFYFAILNPVSFYLIFVYVQLDTVPLYLITLGTLHLINIETQALRATALIALGGVAKLQTLLQTPILAVVFILLVFSRGKIRNGIAVLTASAVGVMLTAGAFFFLHYRPRLALYHLLKNFSQKERVWYTVMPYVPGVVVFVSIFSIAFTHIFFIQRLKSSTEHRLLIPATVLFIAATVGIFSASMLHTPSSLINLTSGLILLFAISKDFFQRMMIFISSVTIIFPWMFTAIGDISKIVPGTQFFTKLIVGMTEAEHSRYESILFSIAVSGLMAISMLMLRTATRLLDGEYQNGI